MASDRHEVIHNAAIAEFTRRGVAGTSMANIAAAAGMSRPALYQYFKNKEDIFSSAFVAVMEAHVDRALAALDEPGSVAEQLDHYLQRFEGDLWEYLAASPYADEILSAKSEYLAAAVGDVMNTLRSGLAAYLRRVSPGNRAADRQRRQAWADLLGLSPKGLKFDEPSVEEFRRRLSTLASGIGADVEATAT